MIKTRKTKELSEISVPLHLNSFTFMQITNVSPLRTIWGVFVIPRDVSVGIYKVHYFAPFQNWRNVRKKGREQYKGG